MDKKLFNQVISSGYIRGHINKAVMYYDSRDLKCDFVSDDRTMVCRTISDRFNGGNNFIGDDSVGIPNIDSFIKMLNTLGSDITIDVERSERNDKHMILRDSMLQMKYGLISTSQMPKIPKIEVHTLVSNPVEIDTDKDFITKFHKLSGAVKDCKYLFISSTENNIDFILSQNEDYNTGAKLSVPLTGGSDHIQLLKFDVTKIRTLLYNNRGAETGKIQFYGEGMAIIKFESKNIISFYYVISE